MTQVGFSQIRSPRPGCAHPRRVQIQQSQTRRSPRAAPLVLMATALIAGCGSAPENVGHDDDAPAARIDQPAAPARAAELTEAEVAARTIIVQGPLPPTMASASSPPPSAAFTAVDSDGDGALSEDEFTSYSRERMGGRPEAFFTRFFDALDTDGDGSASPAEFDNRFEAMQAAQRGGRGGARAARRAAPPVRDLANKEADYDANHRRVVARDTFPVLDNPKMTAATDATLGDEEPVIGVVINGEARAYSVAVMGRHELGNDMCGGTPIAVSW